jgi:hypothetical protein
MVFNVLDGGPNWSLTGGGWVRANRTSSGMKSLISDVGKGWLLSITLLLDFKTGNCLSVDKQKLGIFIRKIVNGINYLELIYLPVGI